MSCPSTRQCSLRLAPGWGASGAKSDPGDSYKLADYLRTDGRRSPRLDPIELGLRELQAPVRRRTLRVGAGVRRRWRAPKAPRILLDTSVAPGESLSIDGLARELGVSPTGAGSAGTARTHRPRHPSSPQGMSSRAGAESGSDSQAPHRGRWWWRWLRCAPPLSDAALAELETAHDDHALSVRRVQRMSIRHPLLPDLVRLVGLGR